ncbi:unnamed protein product [Rotaria sp. Silwood2]|nr:unnamed protein product [Rotaria sp. Silwood2]CAF4701684.1 unnamed protein product [Rotaria sp. Silwood2]
MGRKPVNIDKKKNIIALHDAGMSQHEISRQLHISRQCIRQTIRKFDQLHTVATKPGGGRPKKVTDRQKRAIKLEQLRDDTLSLADLLRYAYINLNLTITRQTVSRILREFNMVSYTAPRKPRTTPIQRSNRLRWCHEHLSWSVNDWSNVIFSDETNFEILNRKNRIYIRRFRTDSTRFERYQKRVHKGGGIGLWSYLTCHGLGPLVIYDGRLNSVKYIDILEHHLSAALQKFPSQQSQKILYQQDNARPHVSAQTQEYLKEQRVKLIPWPANSPDLNIIENIWSILDQKLLKVNINNMDDLKTALQSGWAEISNNTVQKLFESMPKRLREVVTRKGFHSCY